MTYTRRCGACFEEFEQDMNKHPILLCECFKCKKARASRADKPSSDEKVIRIPMKTDIPMERKHRDWIEHSTIKVKQAISSKIEHTEGSETE